MSVWKIAWRSIQQRALASSLTGLSMALGVMLVVAVLVIHGAIDRSFLNNSGLGYNIVVGAKGGRLDLVLNSVYYLSRPIENIPYTYYLEFTQGKFASNVANGDSVVPGRHLSRVSRGRHIVRFSGRTRLRRQQVHVCCGSELQTRRAFWRGGRRRRGARAPASRPGDKFQPSHSGGTEANVHEEEFTVLGVLDPPARPTIAPCSSTWKASISFPSIAPIWKALTAKRPRKLLLRSNSAKSRPCWC